VSIGEPKPLGSLRKKFEKFLTLRAPETRFRGPARESAKPLSSVLEN
jgi:hypothetical protein